MESEKLFVNNSEVQIIINDLYFNKVTRLPWKSLKRSREFALFAEIVRFKRFLQDERYYSRKILIKTIGERKKFNHLIIENETFDFLCQIQSISEKISNRKELDPTAIGDLIDDLNIFDNNIEAMKYALRFEIEERRVAFTQYIIPISSLIISIVTIFISVMTVLLTQFSNQKSRSYSFSFSTIMYEIFSKLLKYLFDFMF